MVSWKVSTLWSSCILSICLQNWPNVVLQSVSRVKGGITTFLVTSSVVCCGIVSLFGDGREGWLSGEQAMAGGHLFVQGVGQVVEQIVQTNTNLLFTHDWLAQRPSCCLPFSNIFICDKLLINYQYHYL